MGRTVIDWTPYRVDILRVRWSEGVHADSIAAEIDYPGMGHAVIAKAMREKLPSRIARADSSHPLHTDPFVAEVPFLRREFSWEKKEANYGQPKSLQYTKAGPPGGRKAADRRPDTTADAEYDPDPDGGSAAVL